MGRLHCTGAPTGLTVLTFPDVRVGEGQPLRRREDCGALAPFSRESSTDLQGASRPGVALRPVLLWPDEVLLGVEEVEEDAESVEVLD